VAAGRIASQLLREDVDAHLLVPDGDLTGLAVTGHPRVRHAGAPTFADAVYIDNRDIGLPSQIGWFTFSMKLYRNDHGATSQPYVPDLPYIGTSWAIESLQE
jgi:hypothetical protein